MGFKDKDLLRDALNSPHGVEIIYNVGEQVAEQIVKDLEDGKIHVEDDIVVCFLPAIIGGGNLHFLQVCARSMYNDTRKDVIVDFLDYMLKLGEKGYNQINKIMEG